MSRFNRVLTRAQKSTNKAAALAAAVSAEAQSTIVNNPASKGQGADVTPPADKTTTAGMNVPADVKQAMGSQPDVGSPLGELSAFAIGWAEVAEFNVVNAAPMKTNVLDHVAKAIAKGAKYAVMRRDGVVGPRLTFAGTLEECTAEAERVKGIVVTVGKFVDSETSASVSAAATPAGHVSVIDLESVVKAGADVGFDLQLFGPRTGSGADILKAGAHWSLFADGKPLAEINLADQKGAEQIAPFFVTDDYAADLGASIRANGLKAALSAANARMYTAAINKDAELQAERSKLRASFDDSVKQARLNACEQILNASTMAIDAMATGFIPENPMRDGITKELIDLGVPSDVAASKADDMCTKHLRETVDAVLKHGNRYSAMTVEARAEISASIRSTGKVRRSTPDHGYEFNGELAHRMATAAVPVAPTNTSPADDGQPVVQASVRTGPRTIVNEFEAGKARLRARMGKS